MLVTLKLTVRIAHGAFGSLAFGIGTSEVEHVLATQTLLQKKAKNMRVTVDGTRHLCRPSSVAARTKPATRDEPHPCRIYIH